MTTVVVLILAGVLAFGLPRAVHRDGWRFWHPWVDNGMVPLLVGAAVGWIWVGGEADSVPPVAVESVQSLLALVLSAAGVLVGTQLRVVYLLLAGRTFLQRQSMRALVLILVALLPLVPLILWRGDSVHLSTAQAISVALVLASLLLCSSQRPPQGAYVRGLDQRRLIDHHVAPCGWWNILALLLAACALQVGLVHGPPIALGLVPAAIFEWAPSWLLSCLIAALVGIALGWLAKGARNRAEASLFLLAVLGIAAGGSLMLSASSLLMGLVVGAAFANVALGRLAMMERQLLDLEQPVVIAGGFLTGLLLLTGPAVREHWSLTSAWWWLDLLALLLVGLRWILRSRFSPTDAGVADRLERAVAAPGAAGLLVLASVVTAAGPFLGLAPTLIVALVLMNVVHGSLEWWRQGRERSRAVQAG